MAKVVTNKQRKIIAAKFKTPAKKAPAKKSGRKSRGKKGNEGQAWERGDSIKCAPDES